MKVTITKNYKVHGRGFVSLGKTGQKWNMTALSKMYNDRRNKAWTANYYS